MIYVPGAQTMHPHSFTRRFIKFWCKLQWVFCSKQTLHGLSVKLTGVIFAYRFACWIKQSEIEMNNLNEAVWRRPHVIFTQPTVLPAMKYRTMNFFLSIVCVCHLFLTFLLLSIYKSSSVFSATFFCRRFKCFALHVFLLSFKVKLFFPFKNAFKRAFWKDREAREELIYIFLKVGSLNCYWCSVPF